MPNASAARPTSPNRALKAVTFFVVFVCVALFIVNGWLAFRGRAEALRQASVSDSNLTHALAQQMDSLFSETSRILDTVAFDLERVDLVKNPGIFDRLQPVLVNYAAGTEQLHSLFIFDKRGKRLLSSEASVSPIPGVESRDYFSYHRNNLSLMRHVGKPIISRLSGLWLIPVSRRFNDLDGEFAGVVMATIEVAHIQKLLSVYQIGQAGAISLNLSDGSLLSRRPMLTSEIGTTVAGTPQFERLRKNLSGTLEMISPLDDVERVVSYQFLKNHPLFVTVALSKEEILQHWRTTTYVQSSWILVLCVFVGLSGAAVIRSVRERLRIERRLRAAHHELTLANTQLTHMARYDSLTGLANRRYFDEHLAREFRNARRTRRPLTLIMIDVDHFKLYNDNYGHPEGDKCLQAVARAVESAVGRPHDFVARYGGEEIVVILTETDAAGGTVVAEAIRLAVVMLNLPFGISPNGFISISAGVAAHVHASPRTSALELLNEADKALYRAKRNGRNTVFTDV
jgi:diguanylate cyclase (GGDEF)-like protein